MKLFAIILHDSDGFTWDADITLGLCENELDAIFIKDFITDLLIDQPYMDVHVKEMETIESVENEKKLKNMATEFLKNEGYGFLYD